MNPGLYYLAAWIYDTDTVMKSVADIRSLLTSCLYLEDQTTEVEGITIHGSPWQPRFSDSAFNLERGEELRQGGYFSFYDNYRSENRLLDVRE